MQAEGGIDLEHDLSRQKTEGRPESFDRDRSDLFGLGFRWDARTTGLRWDKDLEGKDSGRVAGEGNDRHNSSPNALGRGVGSVVADHNRWAALVGLVTPNRVEIDQSNFPATHYDTPSAVVSSHNSRSPERSHSSQAAA